MLLLHNSVKYSLKPPFLRTYNITPFKLTKPVENQSNQLTISKLSTNHIHLQISRRMFPNHYDRDKLDEVELHNKLRHYIVNEVISLQTNKGMVLVRNISLCLKTYFRNKERFRWCVICNKVWFEKMWFFPKNRQSNCLVSWRWISLRKRDIDFVATTRARSAYSQITKEFT